MVLCGAIAWVVAYALPAGIIALPPSLRPMLIASLAGLGLLFNLSPKLAFGRAGTTVNPLRPAASRVLVITGLYRLSRNPMYLGHALLLGAWACWLQHPASLMGAPGSICRVIIW